MENLTNTAVHLLEDSQGADLTRREKRKLSVEITTAMIALVCLVTGLLYKGIFPEQTAVAGLIYSVGVLMEGLPLLATAIRGFLQRDVTNAMEILVSIAVLACYITGQHELAILIPVVLSVVHFLEERSIMGGRDAIEGLKQMQATDAVLETEDGEVTVEVQALKRGDIIIVRPGMGLPIDGTVIWGNSNIDQKSLTGEPLPAAVTVGDTVYAGTTNLDGMIKIRWRRNIRTPPSPRSSACWRRPRASPCLRSGSWTGSCTTTSRWPSSWPPSPLCSAEISPTPSPCWW